MKGKALAASTDGVVRSFKDQVWDTLWLPPPGCANMRDKQITQTSIVLYTENGQMNTHRRQHSANTSDPIVLRPFRGQSTETKMTTTLKDPGTACTQRSKDSFPESALSSSYVDTGIKLRLPSMVAIAFTWWYNSLAHIQELVCVWMLACMYVCAQCACNPLEMELYRGPWATMWVLGT